jgi:predicted phage-related endonuclease
MLNLGLSDEQHEQRRKGIGGSHAPRIMAGDWQPVWLEISGRAKPKKIMSDWNYALRMATETLQLDWYEHLTGDRVVMRGANAVCTEYPFMRATLDGKIESTGEPINCKHVSGWTKEARQWCIEKYTWQIIHEAIVLAAPSERGIISMIVGEKEPEVFPIEADPFSVAELLKNEQEFWQYVIADTPPDGRASVEPPPALWAMRAVDMQSSNSWCENAGIWRENIAASRKAERAAKELRALVDADVREATGHGVTVTRSKDGRSLYLREVK